MLLGNVVDGSGVDFGRGLDVADVLTSGAVITPVVGPNNPDLAVSLNIFHELILVEELVLCGSSRSVDPGSFIEFVALIVISRSATIRSQPFGVGNKGSDGRSINGDIDCQLHFEVSFLHAIGNKRTK